MSNARRSPKKAEVGHSKCRLALSLAVALALPAQAATDLTMLSLEQLLEVKVDSRSIAVQRKAAVESPNGGQIVFVSLEAISTLPRVLDGGRGAPVLTVADSPGAARQGVALNMSVAQNKITFEANLEAVRAARLNLSSKLLCLASEVRQ